MARSLRTLVAVLVVLAAVAAVVALALRERRPPAEGASAHPPQASDRPDILLVTIDTLRGDHLGVAGGPGGVTPRIDTLAKEGAWFADAETPAPSTLASHASLFTSRVPHRHGVSRNGYRLHDDAETLAERLAGAGYETAAFVSSFAVVRNTGIGQGFRTFDEGRMEMRGGYHIEQPAEMTNARVLDWWASRKADAPWFAWVHYFDPHYPYQPQEPFASRFAGGYSGPVTGSMRDVKEIRRRFVAGGDVGEDGRQLQRLYAGEVAYTDFRLGELLDGLRERGALERALVVVTSDHGETFGEHAFGAFDHGQNVYRTNVHVPLVVWSPRWLSSRGRIDGAASILDLAPTLLAWAGAPPLSGAEGMDLRPALEGKAPLPPDRLLYAEATRGRSRGRTAGWPNASYSRAVREGEARLVRRRSGIRLRDELFDLSRDPGEARDLSSQAGSDDALRRLGEGIAEFDRSQGTFVPPRPMEDIETLEKLKALGYVDEARSATSAGGEGTGGGEGEDEGGGG